MGLWLLGSCNILTYGDSNLLTVQVMSFLFRPQKPDFVFFIQKEKKLKKESCSISLSWFFQATSVSHGLVLSFREIIWGHPHSTNLWTTWTDAVTHQPKHTYRHTQTRPSCAPHIHNNNGTSTHILNVCRNPVSCDHQQHERHLRALWYVKY